jgi:CheY-like chemotaxis protein
VSILFLENTLQEVATALASLSDPTPEKVEQIATSFRAIRIESEGTDSEDLSRIASEIEKCARDIMLDKANGQASCVKALSRLGYMVLLSLAKHAESPKAMAETHGALERKVLVVDDSRVAAVALSKALKAKDFMVTCVATMEDAIAEIRGFSPTMLVSDVQMPDLDVTALCRSFRELSQGRPTLIVLVSATVGPELEARLGEIRPDAFVAKMGGVGPVISRVQALWDTLDAETSKQSTA